MTGRSSGFLTTRTALVFSLSLAGAPLLVLACGDGHPSAAGGGSSVYGTNVPGDPCATPNENCPCSETGRVVDCGYVKRQAADYVTCSMGKRTCTPAGLWGACEGDRIALQSLPGQHEGFRLSNLASNTACTTNPCDPYCQTYLDTPNSLDAGTGLVATDSGVTLSGEAGSSSTTTYVYGHSHNKLYKMDPATLGVSYVGDFKDVGSGSFITDMTDVALDKNGVMYGVTFGKLYKMASGYAGNPVMCTFLANLATSFNGLTFVPAGMGLDPVNETLVGISNAGGWYKVNLAPVSLTLLGSYGAGYTSSGDSVGIIGDKIYATVNVTGQANVHVITVNAANGNKIADLGSTSVSTGIGIFGVGYWGGKMYGFAGDGKLHSINLSTGASTYISQPTTEWWGAGVTTAAVTSPSTYVDTDFVRDFDGVCPSSTTPVWHFYDYKTVTPSTSQIIFSAKTASTIGGLATATSVNLATVSGASITSWTGVDVATALGAIKSQRYLRVTARLKVSADGLSPPTLTAWRQAYTCDATE